MRQSNGVYVFESPHDALYDAFRSAGADSADFHGIIIENYLGLGGFGFEIRSNSGATENFAVSEFEFDTKNEALAYLEDQVPYVEVSGKRRGTSYRLSD